MDNYSITQNGKPLSKDKYCIDLKNKVFSSTEGNLVLDFNDLEDWTLNTKYGCIFNTSINCTFNTGPACVFCTDNGCTFTTGNCCTFVTGMNCTFKTGSGCTFDTNSGCTFDTNSGCIFLLCDINTCKFKSYDNISIILDRIDRKSYKLTKEIIQLLKVTNG